VYHTRVVAGGTRENTFVTHFDTSTNCPLPDGGTAVENFVRISERN